MPAINTSLNKDALRSLYKLIGKREREAIKTRA
jgi:hypothetical protein